MELSYWQSRWQNDKTGWHMDVVYPLLKQYWQHLQLPEGANVLVPLCGKSKDLHWLADHHFHVIGVDVSQKALQSVMDKRSEAFSKSTSHGLTRYRSEAMELWEGDFLKVPAAEIPPLHAIYDKAALIALPPQQRKAYADKVLELCSPSTQIFLQTFEYEQAEMNGPPFSVHQKEVNELFGKHFKIDLLHEQSKFEELQGFHKRGLTSYLLEKVYLLRPA